MQYKDQLIRMTQKVADDFVKNVKAIPADKLNWKVEDSGRSAMDIFQEVAQAPTYAVPMLATRTCPDFNPETFGKMKAERAEWDTVEKCEAKLKQNLNSLFESIRSFPDNELATEIDLPFVEGMRQSMADIMAYPYWNTSYHLGQVCFIQTLYGDWDMR